MKFKYIIGAVIVIGAIVGTTYLIKSNKEKNAWDKDFDATPSKPIKPAEVAPREDTKNERNSKDDFDDVKSEFVEKKTESVDTISARHKEAAKVMEESLRNIVDESSAPETKSENADDLDDMDDALDKLLDK